MTETDEINETADQDDIIDDMLRTISKPKMAKLNAAVTKVMLAYKRLKKEHDNAFANYQYTSIDDFKDALRPVMAKHGLRISMDEISCEIWEYDDAQKKHHIALKFAFSCTLHHESGESGEPERITVVLPFSQAQTTGQARSYALKEYLKSCFMASSGDSEDADQDDEKLELSKSEARELSGTLEIELQESIQSGPKAMKAWYDRRKPSIDALPSDWRLHLRRRYKEGIATGKTPKKSADKKTVDADPEFNVAEFFENLELALKGAKSSIEIEELWTEFDIESQFRDDDESREIAEKIKARFMDKMTGTDE